MALSSYNTLLSFVFVLVEYTAWKTSQGSPVGLFIATSLAVPILPIYPLHVAYLLIAFATRFDLTLVSGLLAKPWPST